MDKDKDLDKIGAHCAMKDCHVLDFLPFQCDKCFVKYCLEHSNYDAHNCKFNNRDVKVHPCPVCNALIPIPNGASVDECFARHLTLECTDKQLPSKVPKSFTCSAKACKSTEFVKVLCEKCNQNFCLKHRFPTSHQCQSLTSPKSTSPPTSLFKPNSNNNRNNNNNKTTPKTTTSTNKNTNINRGNEEINYQSHIKNQQDQLKEIRSKQNEDYRANSFSLVIIMTNSRELKHQFRKDQTLRDLQTFINSSRTDGDAPFCLAPELNLSNPFTITQLDMTLEQLKITNNITLIMIELIDDNPNQNLKKTKSV
ncbi:AN1-type zinc finger-containing protein [Tieghemostelium lacteum]|uniref:AN1-type zinc finger-containing protein n=1 Tax=Tieghemostelium lacteum TaxID=361077 RepID=A0A151ZS84_TIELA|nr:AN1-type zinc finger-containing protein [Tieghemostelium lacteum]|eukprot:KYQ96853.1 AN1-type zinc finger-containing protein [Tieghemostelium lacteum]